MATPPLVTLDEFVTWSARPVANEERAEAVIAAASSLVRTATGGRMWLIDDGGGVVPEGGVTDLELDAVKTVVLQVSSRVFFNPEGARSMTTGPFSTNPADWFTVGMDLTDAERAQLPASSPFRGLGVISTTRGPIETGSALRPWL